MFEIELTSASFSELVRIVSVVFYYGVLLCVMTAGLVMMVAPRVAWQILKNAGMAVLIFILGGVLLGLLNK